MSARVVILPAPHPPTRVQRFPAPLSESARVTVEGPAMVRAGGLPVVEIGDGARAEFAGAVLASAVGADGRRCDVLGWKLL